MKKGDTGTNVKKVQKFVEIVPDGIFGNDTKRAVQIWQHENGLTPDGIVGENTLKLMGITLEVEKFDEKYKGVTIQGSVFPDKPVISTLKVNLTKELKAEYLPVINKKNMTKGLRLLCTIMAHKEGFRYGTRSYRTNNPGNIGNTDSGKNKANRTLREGIDMQIDYIISIINDEHHAYPMNRKKIIKPYFSKEIAKHSKMYGMSPYVPGYEFVFTGQLDQFVKIYSTGARAGNGYLSMIISYFKQNGIEITAKSKIQDIL